jgi:F-type H+-transporting ATPase subunit delta
MARDFARPYVDAFFEVAGSGEAVEKELGPLEAVEKALLTVPDLSKTLANPGLPRARREALLDAVAGKAAAGTLGRRLLRLLLHNRRLPRISHVIAALHARLDRERNVLEARIATARPLDPALVEELRALVEKRAARRVRVMSVVNPALLGGFVVTAGSARYDASLARRLQKVREAVRALPSV